jgi:hypothetical protein
MVYYYAYALKNNISVRFATNLSFALLLGGTTITNVAKGIIPLFFIEKSWRNFIKKLFIIGGVFFVIFLLIKIFGRLDPIISDYVKFSKNPSDFWMSICAFFGAPIFLTGLKDYTRIVSEYLVFNHAIDTTFYAHWWQYAFLATLYALIIYSLIINWRNRLVQLLFLLFGVDIFIHIILRFGLTESFIYGGHWVYCLPLLMGWMFHYASDKKILKTTLMAVTSLLLAGLIVNNLVRLADFIHLALKYWAV